MEHFRAGAENRLREHGYRLTRPRRQVLAVLAQSDRAMSPYAILEQLAHQGESPDVVTVYRILELLESLQLVHRVHTLNGYIACHRASREGCHHPVICTRCGRIDEVGEHLLHALEEQVRARGWRLERHVLEFSGVCPQCQQQGQKEEDRP